jgi:hypothetical protein
MIGFNFQLLTDLSSFWFLSWNIILLTWEGGGDSRYFCILIGGSRALFRDTAVFASEFRQCKAS